MDDLAEQMFGKAEVEAPEPAPEIAPEVVEAPVTPEPEQPEPVPPAPEPEPQPEPAPAQDHTVPLAKYLDTRDEAKELKRRIAEYESRERQAQTPQPDPFDDPAGYGAHVQSQVQKEVMDLRFQMSDQLARQVHGDETVNKAVEWAQDKARSDPAFATSYMQSPNPIDHIVRQHKRDAMLSDIGEDPDAYVRRRAAELGLIQSAAPAAVAPLAPAAIAQPAPVPATPPRSIASAPGSGNGAPGVKVGSVAGVEGLFPQG